MPTIRGTLPDSTIAKIMDDVRAMLQREGVKVVHRAGLRDTTKPGDEYRSWEHDGSLRIVVETPNDFGEPGNFESTEILE